MFGYDGGESTVRRTIPARVTFRVERKNGFL